MQVTPGAQTPGDISIFRCRNDWEAIPGKYVGSLPFHIHLVLRNPFHEQFCGRAEIILVRTSFSWMDRYISRPLLSPSPRRLPDKSSCTQRHSAVPPLLLDGGNFGEDDDHFGFHFVAQPEGSSCAQ